MIRFFDIFAGIGGFRSGLERAGGFECVGYCEVDKYAKQAYEALYDTSKEVYYDDARTIDPEAGYNTYTPVFAMGELEGAEFEVKAAEDIITADGTVRAKAGERNPYLRRHVRKYSLGMRQRLGLAQAIMENPKILILDEPFNGLDKEGVAEMREYLLSYKEQGKTILICSHSAEDISVLCETVHEMDKGLIQQI